MGAVRTEGTLAVQARLQEAEAAAGDTEEIYRSVFEAIVDHRLLPGTQLKEDVLCEIFKVGRTRIRKVLARLAADNIVDLFPHRGAFVAHPTVEEAKEVFRARRVVEAHLVRAAAENRSDAARSALRRHIGLEQEARESGHQSAAIRLCGDFHLILADLAKSPIMGRFLLELVSRTSLIVAIYESHDTTSCEMDEHKALAKAVISGQADRAAELMMAHLDGIEGRLNLHPPKKIQLDIQEALTARPS
jgi:DNA-binding GntR family transcriptional regulator